MFFMLVQSVNAGGGLNAILDPEWAVGFTGDEGMKITAVVYNDSLRAPHNQGFVVGNEFVFEIEDVDNSKGQFCQTIKPISDNQGKVEGVCFAKKAGFLKVYLREASSIQRTRSSTLKFIYPPGENPSINSVTSPQPTPIVTNLPDDKETNKKIDDLENQVESLTKSLDDQDNKINTLQLLLEKIISFLEKIPLLNLFQSNK